MRNLYIDFDGVLFDTVTYAFLEMKKLGVDISNDDAITDYFVKVDWLNLINKGGIPCADLRDILMIPKI